MKAIVAPYGTATWCVRIECTNGLIVRLTSYPYDIKMSNGTLYKTDNGYEPSALASSVGFAAPAIDIEGIAIITGIDRDKLASGVFDNARVYIFKCDYLNPIEDYEEVTVGLFGKTTLIDNTYRIEGIGIVDVLNQTVGTLYTALCSHTFGNSRCGKNLASITVTGTITHVANNYLFRDENRTEPVDYFTAGTIAFTSGLNNGLKAQEIMAHSANGSIQTFEPFHYTPAIGDTYTLIPGCRKRKVDCQAWNNVVNAMAFWDIPVESDYLQVGGQ